MDIGMLWFDDDPKRDLEAKVANAVKHYREKFGQQPTVCYVHPSMLSEPATMANVLVKPSRTVMHGHLWIGVQHQQGEPTG